MRYYDTKLTPITGKTFLKDGIDRIAETDERVSVWFQSIDKVKFDRAFDTNGLPMLLEYALDINGERYSHYQSTPDVNGIYQADTARIDADAVAKVFSYFTSATNDYIQETIIAYNKANGVDFSDINTFPKYAINTASEHYVIANKFIVWVDLIWVAVRAIEVQPTDAEFKAILDAVVF